MPNSYIRVGRVRKTDSSHRVPVPRWVDPFPGMQGSSIEKMVMAEFSRRGIYFEHSTTTNPVHWVSYAADMFKLDPKTIKADFLLPQYKIWLEIQGAYFHTLPGAVEHDALRFALIEASGWKPIFWWEDDIRTRLQDLMNAVPQFYRVDKKKNANQTFTRGFNFYEGKASDTLKGLRSALAGRAKPNQTLKVKRRKKRKKKYGS